MHPVIVRDNNVERAIRRLKRMAQKEGTSKEWRKRRFYMKPSEKRKKKESEAFRRVKKNLEKRFLKEGY